MTKKPLSLTVSMLLLAAPALAGDRGPRRGPPLEATKACASSSSGAACSFTVSGHTVSGTCEAPPDESAGLACRPSGPPPGHHRGPPPEATTACASSSSGATCSFTIGDRTVSGTCEAPPDGSSGLACRPSGPPPGHHGPPPEATKACEGLSADAACAFAHGSINVTGRCAALPGDTSGSLSCRPDRLPR